MNSYLVESECAYVQQYVRAGLAETHMVVLAAIIRDLDRETAKSDSGKFSALQMLYYLFAFSDDIWFCSFSLTKTSKSDSGNFSVLQMLYYLFVLFQIKVKDDLGCMLDFVTVF